VRISLAQSTQKPATQTHEKCVTYLLFPVLRWICQALRQQKSSIMLIETVGFILRR